MKTYDEHLAECKNRAREYIKRGDYQNAFVSFGSDMEKHPEAKRIVTSLMPVGLLYVMQGDNAGIERWIEGFR